MKKPKVSIVVPVYQAEKSIDRCINSIIEQTFTNWELILVDDGSTDNSGCMCDDYAKKDNRIKVIHKTNGGVSSARNKGIEVIDGDYLWFVDSDDWIQPDAIAKLVGCLERTNSDICFFQLNVISKNIIEPPFSFDPICFKNPYLLFEGRVACASVLVQLEMLGGLGWTWNKIFKTSFIKQNNLFFDEQFSIQEDHMFTFSYLMYVNKIVVTIDAPYNYVVEDSNSLLHKNYPFENTKLRNQIMYNYRLQLCKVFEISDEKYIQWFNTDFAVRAISNLRSLKTTNFTLEQIKNEIKLVIDFIQNHQLASNKRILQFKILSRLPNVLIFKIMSL